MKDEYDSYRQRVRRDRRSVGGIAVANVLTGLLPVLDAIDEARRHDDVTGGFEYVVDLLESQLTALGLQSFGAPGDPFDPARHEAVSTTAPTRWTVPPARWSCGPATASANTSCGPQR